MELLYTGNSPYSRRARLAVRLGGLMNATTEVNVAPRDENLDKLIAASPAAKVPVLVTDSGHSMCESLLIGRYLDDLSGGKLLPAESGARENAQAVDSIASALLDSFFVRSREQRRDTNEQSPGVIKLEKARTKRLLDRLEEMTPDFGGHHLGTITVASGLGYADWRHAADNWRAGRPLLAAWFDAVSKEAAFAETAPVY